jgi:Spy/CpxP family protein refolding chaperone
VEKEQVMRKPAIWAAAMLLMLLSGWAFGWFDSGNYSDDPAVAELEKQRDKVFARHDKMDDEQKRAERRELEEKARNLSREQQMALFESSLPLIVPMAARRFEEHFDQFMELSPEEQEAELDRRIDAMESRGPRGDRQPPSISPEKMQSLQKQILGWTTPEQRGKFQQGIEIFNKRRQQRGLPPISPPGGGFL